MMGGIGEFISDHTGVSIILIIGTFVVILSTVEQVSKCVRKRAFEQSRREIAAYVAEGTISPEQAATLLAVSGPSAKSSSPAKKLAEAVAWGTVAKGDSRKLVDARAGADEAAWKEMVELVLEGMSAEDAIRLVRAGKSGSAVATSGATPATA